MMATTTTAQNHALVDSQKVTPNQSLYIQNLPTNIQREDIRRGLYMLFSTYGSVLDVNAIRNAKMRGQAHVLFKDIQTATQAMRACQGFEFFGRPIRINYSKNRSDTLSKLTGIFQSSENEDAKPVAQKQQSSGLPLPPGQQPQASSIPALPSGLPPPPGMASANGLKAPATEPNNAPSPQGTKRARDDSDDEGVPMEDSDDDDGAMDMSDDD